MAYADKTSVEGVLGRSLTTSEASALPSLLAAVDAYIDRMTGRNFEAAEGVETRYYDVERSMILDVDPFIMDDDHELIVKYVDADEEEVSVVDESDFEARPRNTVEKSYLQRRSTPWGTGCVSKVTNIAITAYFGGDGVPADIAYAAAWLAAQAVGSTDSLSLKSESIEGYSRTFADATKSNSMIEDTLSQFDEVIF